MANEKVFTVDKNLCIETSINKQDIAFFDVREAPFEVYGLYGDIEKNGFRRLPEEVAKNNNSYTGKYLKNILNK